MAELPFVFAGGLGVLRIFWVDDEPGLVTAYRVAVEQAFGKERLSFHTTVLGTVAAVEAAAQEHPRPSAVLVWDMMLPTEPGMDAERVGWGTRTGAQMYHAFRKSFPEGPTILLSHLSDFRLIEEYGRRPRERAWMKSSTTPEMLVGWIRELALEAYGPAVLAPPPPT